MDARIDFLARRRWPPAGWVLATLAAALLAWQGGLALREADTLRGLQADLARLQRQASASRAPAMSPEDARRQRQIEALALYLATPWDRLLALFEEHAGSRVVLMKFEPDAAEGRVEVLGRADNATALVDYLMALERDPRLRGVMLRHHEVKRSEARQPIDFTLGAAWGDTRHAAPPVTGPSGPTPRNTPP